MPRTSKTTTKTTVKAVKSVETSRLADARSKNIVRAKSKTTTLSVPVYSLLGKETGTLALPKEYFGQKVNKPILAQAIRVYMTNQKNMTASTKTRGEVRGTTKKMYSQKGTGRARHGAATAPIFVGGGIVFGPRPRVVRLALSKKMKKAALISSLSDKAAEGLVLAVSGLEKASGKTKQMDTLLQKIGVRSGLILTGNQLNSVVRAVRNIPKMAILPINQANAYEVIKHQTLIITKEAITGLGKGSTK